MPIEGIARFYSLSGITDRHQLCRSICFASVLSNFWNVTTWKFMW